MHIENTLVQELEDIVEGLASAAGSPSMRVGMSKEAKVVLLPKGRILRRVLSVMSRIPISTKVPTVAIQFHETRRSSSARELRTQPTPRPPVIALNVCGETAIA